VNNFWLNRGEPIWIEFKEKNYDIVFIAVELLKGTTRWVSDESALV